MTHTHSLLHRLYAPHEVPNTFFNCDWTIVIIVVQIKMLCSTIIEVMFRPWCKITDERKKVSISRIRPGHSPWDLSNVWLHRARECLRSLPWNRTSFNYTHTNISKTRSVFVWNDTYTHAETHSLLWNKLLQDVSHSHTHTHTHTHTLPHTHILRVQLCLCQAVGQGASTVRWREWQEH